MASTAPIPTLLVTANVGSIFEDPSQMLKIWTEEFLATVTRLDPKFIALHCQEVGGKNYENSMKHVEQFVKLLMDSNELRLFDKIRVFLDEDYSSAENFTALGNLYFIHETVDNVLIWDFNDSKFVTVQGKEINSGNIEAVSTKEKAKFPQDFFPECKWSRKGFLRTRWSLNNTVFDLVNIHLFHDASNFVAMETYPSVYCKNRRRALEHTLQRFHNDRYGRAPHFVFGDFNFRMATDAVIKTLTEGLTQNRLQNNKNNDHTKLQYYGNDDSELVLTVGKKEFNHLDHQKVFLTPSPTWLKQFDKEPEAFDQYLTEYPITFPPSYPFEEKIGHGTNYMQTRCPAWCDRVLLSHTAQQLVAKDAKDEDDMVEQTKDKVEYGIIGLDTCMGDHKPVYLRVELSPNAGTLQCCQCDMKQARIAYPHSTPLLLSSLSAENATACPCCLKYAAVTINVIDMSANVTNDFCQTPYPRQIIDVNLLHEPITRAMLAPYEPYTPESAESRSPLPEDDTSAPEVATTTAEVVRRDSVSPEQLKSRLESILAQHEHARRWPTLMVRSRSETIDFGRHKAKMCCSTHSLNALSRQQSRSSDEDWYECEQCENNGENDAERKMKSKKKSATSEVITVKGGKTKRFWNGNNTDGRNKKLKCCCIV